MMLERRPAGSLRVALYVLLGSAVLAAIPVGLRWAERRDGPVTRLAREKRAAMDYVASAARRDLPCDAIEIRQPGGELWAHGCGKRARYVPTRQGTYELAGKIGPDEPEEAESGCAASWTRGADAGSAREAAATIHASGQRARLRVPIAAFGVEGLAKLRYGEHVDVFVEVDADADAGAGAATDRLHVPCIDPAADGGVREGRCAMDWDSVAEVAECR